ncbi:DNA-binding protein [Betaproteobacteria bacterium]|nr:DNA-binding protein [Betaproteobacteria bacterium]
MKIAVDTNVLLRVLLGDDEHQAGVARDLLDGASTIVIPVPVLCEIVWNLLSSKKMSRSEVADALWAVVDTETVVVNRPAVEFGLEVFSAGGDFADAVIAFEGCSMGAELFATFDKKAALVIRQHGIETRLLK